jgi:hypothetical protein
MEWFKESYKSYKTYTANMFHIPTNTPKHLDMQPAQPNNLKVDTHEVTRDVSLKWYAGIELHTTQRSS